MKLGKNGMPPVVGYQQEQEYQLRATNFPVAKKEE